MDDNGQEDKGLASVGGDYSLKPETLKNLNLNADYSVADPSKVKKVEVKDNTDLAPDEVRNIMLSGADEENIVIPNETTNDPDDESDQNLESHDENLDEHSQSDDGKESKDKKDGGDNEPEGDPPSFDQEVNSILSERFAEDDKEGREAFIKNLKEGTDFVAANTQRAQDLSNERQAFDAVIAGVSDILKSIEDDPETSGALETLDDWYDDDNPIRILIDKLKSAGPEPLTEKQVEDAALSAQLDLKKELVALTEFDEKYATTEERNTVAKIADDEKVNLIQAAKIRAFDEGSVKNSGAEIAKLNKRIETLEKELKTASSAQDEKPEAPSGGLSGGVGNTTKFIPHKSGGSTYDEVGENLRRNMLK